MSDFSVIEAMGGNEVFSTHGYVLKVCMFCQTYGLTKLYNTNDELAGNTGCKYILQVDMQLEVNVPRCTVHIADETGLLEPLRVTLWREKAEYGHILCM